MCESVAGYSPYQWAYGRNDGEIAEDEKLWQHGLSYRDAKHDFTVLARNRAEAEECYRRSKALERLSILKNSKVRQPET